MLSERGGGARRNTGPHSSLIVLIFRRFSSYIKSPLSLYLFLQTGRSKGLRRKKRRGVRRGKKQNKFANKLPEATRLCGLRLHLPAEARRSSFKGHQQRRAFPLTGRGPRARLSGGAPPGDAHPALKCCFSPNPTENKIPEASAFRRLGIAHT